MAAAKESIGSPVHGFLKPSDSTWDGWGDRTVYTAAGLTPTRASADGPGDVFSGLWNANTPDHRTFLADRIYRMYFNNGVMTPARNDARLRTRCAQIEKAMKSECARWYANSATNFRTFASWTAARDSVLNTWLPANTTTVLNTFRTRGFYPALAENREAPTLNQQGGAVAAGFQPNFAGPSAPVSAQIYYTTDGTDPRLPGGGISSKAQLFSLGTSAALSGLTKSTVIKSRQKNPTTGWSAMNEALFQIGTTIAPGEVVVSELNFNPLAGDVQEFIELRNVSARAVNLRGAAFTDGVLFTFSDYYDTILAPGERVVLVKDLLAFRSVFGTEIPVAGVYDGNLDDGGELVTFSSAASGGEVLDSFTYDGAQPWPQPADGGGYSLTRLLPVSLPGSSPFAWRASVTTGGSPMATDGILFLGDPLSDTDGDGLSALVEYAMGTNATIASSGIAAMVTSFDEEGRLQVTLPRNLLAEDVICTCETTENFTDWMPAELVSRVTDGTSASDTWRCATPAGSRAFIRMRVSKP